MNKTIISIIIGVVVVAGIAIIATRPKVSDAPQNTQTDTSATTTATTTNTGTTTPGGKKMAFSSFIKQGGSYQCTVTQYIDSAYTSSTMGTVYISGEKIRGNYSVEVQGMKINGSVIVRDGFAYTWSSMASIGYKAKVTETANGSAQVNVNNSGSAASGSFSWNSDMIGDYDCKPWTTVESQFTLPASITFKEV